MNLKEIKEMINLMNENNLMELEIEKEGMRIRLRKTASGGLEGVSSPIIIEKEKISQPAPADAKQVSEVSEKTILNSLEIKAPMVGTFYRAPSPEAPPYVQAGQAIEPGQVMRIVQIL